MSGEKLDESLFWSVVASDSLLVAYVSARDPHLQIIEGSSDTIDHTLWDGVLMENFFEYGTVASMVALIRASGGSAACEIGQP